LIVLDNLDDFDWVVVEFFDFCNKMFSKLEAGSYDLDTTSGRRFRIKMYKEGDDIVLRVREDDWHEFDNRKIKEVRGVFA